MRDNGTYEIFPAATERARGGVLVRWSWRRRFRHAPTIAGPLFDSFESCIAAILGSHGNDRKPSIRVALDC
jgi:hypothetical protein